MLILSRNVGEVLTIFLPDGGEVTVSVMDVGNGKVRLAFVAPADVEVWRNELIKPELLAGIESRRAATRTTP